MKCLLNAQLEGRIQKRKLMPFSELLMVVLLQSLFLLLLGKFGVW